MCGERVLGEGGPKERGWCVRIKDLDAGRRVVSWVSDALHAYARRRAG